MLVQHDVYGPSNLQGRAIDRKDQNLKISKDAALIDLKVT